MATRHAHTRNQKRVTLMLQGVDEGTWIKYHARHAPAAHRAHRPVLVLHVRGQGASYANIRMAA